MEEVTFLNQGKCRSFTEKIFSGAINNSSIPFLYELLILITNAIIQMQYSSIIRDLFCLPSYSVCAYIVQS